MITNNIKEYEDEMRWVMRYAVDNGDFNRLDNEEQRLLKECVDAEYIEGIELSEAASGLIVGQIRHATVLTRAGVEFLSKNNKVEERERTSSDERRKEAEHYIHLI